MRAEVDIVLGSVTLACRFRTASLMAFTRMHDMGLSEFLSEVSSDNGMRFLARHDTLIDLIVSGLCHHKEYRTGREDRTRDRICDLIDAEITKTGKSQPEILEYIGGLLLPAFFEGVAPKQFEEARKKGEAQEGNGGPLAQSGPGEGSSSDALLPVVVPMSSTP